MTDGERLGDEGVRLGPIQWAVVTRCPAPAGLFVRLEDSGEKAFMDMVSVDDHSVCCNPEYWPDAGEHIRVRARRHAMTEVDDMSVRGASRLQAGIHGRRQDLPGGGQEGRIEIALDDDGRPAPVLSVEPLPVVGA